MPDPSQSESVEVGARKRVLRVLAWHTECGECGYGRGGWASSPAREGKQPLVPDSHVCHGCGVRFTHVESPYEGTVTVLPDEAVPDVA